MKDGWKIEIDPKPRSLLPEDFKIDLLGEKYEVTLVHLQRYLFRLLLRPLSSLDDSQTPEAMMLDLHLEAVSMKSLFKRCMDSESKELLPKLLAGSALSPKDIQSLQSVCNVDKETVCLLPGSEVLKTAQAMVTQVVGHLEEYLKYRQYTVDTLKNVNYLLAAKLTSWSKKRYTIFEVCEAVPSTKTFTIKARNCFETYSNCRASLPRRGEGDQRDRVLRVEAARDIRDLLFRIRGS